MVKIRLTRIGKRKQPAYRVVAVDSRRRRDGRVLEFLGYYNPVRKEVRLKQERISGWIGKGAQMSDTVRSLFKTARREETREEGRDD